VKEARESVTWSLFFIFLLYFTAPALAVLGQVRGLQRCWWADRSTSSRPGSAAWSKVDPSLLSVVGHQQATASCSWARCASAATSSCWPRPRSPACPMSISGLVAAGGLAAALSTADGLLLTIANALCHDLYYKMIDP
jgi:cation/acetate symporter